MYCKVLKNLYICSEKVYNKEKTMNNDNIKSQMRKGMLEFCILLVLRRGAAYSSDLIRCLKEAHLIVMEGTLYPLLSRMRKDGLLEYTWQESTSGPPRKYYSLSEEGENALLILKEAWNDISRTVSQLSENKEE